MSGFLRRLRPDHLTGQISILVFAAIIVFHVSATLTLHLRNPHWRHPSVDPSELAASAILAIDHAAISERTEVLSALEKMSPWVRFSIQDNRPREVSPKKSQADIDELKSRMIGFDDVFVISNPTDAHPAAFATQLHKGGYLVATPLEYRRPYRADAASISRSGASAIFTMAFWERSALFYLLWATVLTIWVSNSIVRPLVRLGQAAEQFPDETGNQSPITESGPQEVRNLAKSINRMQSRIQAMIKARGQALAAISHDMRTIITRIRLRAEFIEDDTIKSKMLRDAELMDSMLYKNLQHLREVKDNPELCVIDLDSVLQTVVDEFVDMGHKVAYDGGRHQVIRGSMGDMLRVFNNLVENAVQHGQQVVISVEQPTPDVYQIDVADDGPGIAEEDKLRVIAPFTRGQPARNMNTHCGFGLGLSIVNTLVTEAAGVFSLVDREPHGLIARVTLPRAPLAIQQTEGSVSAS